MTTTIKRSLACVLSLLLVVSLAVGLTVSRPSVAQAEVQSSWNPTTKTMIVEADLAAQFQGDSGVQLSQAVEYLLAGADKSEVERLMINNWELDSGSFAMVASADNDNGLNNLRMLDFSRSSFSSSSFSLEMGESYQFNWIVGIEEMRLPEGIEIVADGSLHVYGLKTLILPSTLQIIEENAIISSDLRYINFHELVNLEQLPRYAFHEGPWFEYVDLSRSKLTELPDAAFSLFSLEIEDTVKAVHLPETLNYLGYESLRMDTRIEKLYLSYEGVVDMSTDWERRVFIGVDEVYVPESQIEHYEGSEVWNDPTRYLDEQIPTFLPIEDCKYSIYGAGDFNNHSLAISDTEAYMGQIITSEVTIPDSINGFNWSIYNLYSGEFVTPFDPTAKKTTFVMPEGDVQVEANVRIRPIINHDIKVGDTFTLHAEYPSPTAEGRAIPTWDFDSSFVSVKASGMNATFTAKKAGTTTITFTDAFGMTDSTEVTIRKK